MRANSVKIDTQSLQLFSLNVFNRNTEFLTIPYLQISKDEVFKKYNLPKLLMYCFPYLNNFTANKNQTTASNYH